MTKIDIVSGFLGAGKTTLIQKLLKEALAGTKVVLIENEFGEIGVDGGFLKDAGIEIKEMNSGCICCSLVGDFGTSLKEVMSVYEPERILIEPSGVGKLSDVEKAITDVEFDGKVALNSAVVVVDATKCKMYIKNFGEFFLNQIEHAGTIILSRTGSISEEKLQTAISLIREHNEKATIITTPWEQLDGKDILETIEGATDWEAELLEQVKAEHAHHHDHGPDCTCGCHDHEHEHHHDHEEHEHHHHDHEEHEHHHHDHEEHEHHHHHDHEEHEHHHHDHEEHEHHHHDHEEHEHHHHDHEEHEHHHHDHEEHEHHHHDHEEHEHHHHDHGEHEHHHHDHEEHEHHHHDHGPDCTCGCHDHDHDHHDHHHHHADDVFTSFGKETPKAYSKAEIETILSALEDGEKYGMILRAKGMVANKEAGDWIYFDYVPGEPSVRSGKAEVTGKICVIGSKIQEEALAELFGI